MRVFPGAKALFSASLRGSRMRDLLGVLFKRAGCVTNGYAVEECSMTIIPHFSAN